MCDFGACCVKCNEESDFRNKNESEIQQDSYNMNIGADYYNINNSSTSYSSARPVLTYVSEVSLLVENMSVMKPVLAESELQRQQLNIWHAVLDTGATVILNSIDRAVLMGLQITPHTDGRKVGTVD